MRIFGIGVCLQACAFATHGAEADLVELASYGQGTEMCEAMHECVMEIKRFAGCYGNTMTMITMTTT